MRSPSRSIWTRHVDRKIRRFMGDGSAYNYVAMQEAIARCRPHRRRRFPTSAAAWSWAPAAPRLRTMVQADRSPRARRAPSRVGPYMVPRCMSSTNSANLATSFQDQGRDSYSISRRPARPRAHCVGNGAELIQSWASQDIVFAGGGEELRLDPDGAVRRHGGAVERATTTRRPSASRAYDRRPRRLRDLRRRRRRGARGATSTPGHAAPRSMVRWSAYAATSDGASTWWQPSGRRRRRAACAWRMAEPRQHSRSTTSTPTGPPPRWATSRELERDPGGLRRRYAAGISSTKSLSGHSQGATGVHEAIYSLLMMRQQTSSPPPRTSRTSIPEAEGMPIVTRA